MSQPTDRRDGWYWIKAGHRPTARVPAYYDSSMDEWRSAQAAPYRIPPAEIGPRIPSPDEPQAIHIPIESSTLARGRSFK